MSFHQINKKTVNQANPKRLAIFDIGFRPFFLGAGTFSAFSIIYWMGIYVFGHNITIENFNDKLIIVLFQNNKFFDFRTELKISDYPEDIDKLNLLKSFYKNLEFA